MSKTTTSKVNPESLLKDADYSKTSQFDKTHRQIKTLNDPRFGDVHILQNPSTRQVIAVRERKVTDKAEAGRLILAARNRMALNNPYLINLLDYSVIKQSELCSSFYIIKYYFDYPRTDMRKYIQEKEKSGQSLSSAELTHLLYQQNQAQAYLQSQGMAHGDMQPLYIGWDPERMQSKLIDKSDALTNDAAIISAQKNRMISGQPLYMSPLMYSNLKKGNTKFQFDRNKEDAFGLGLMLLEAGNGHSIQNIYDAKTGQVNQSILAQHVSEFNRKYGAQNNLLVSGVQNMTAFDESSRMSPAQIQSSLPPYEEIKTRLVSSGSTGEGIVSGQTGGSSQFLTSGQYGSTGQFGASPNFGAIPGGVDQTIRSVIQGGDTKTVITKYQEMPTVNEDLFAFDNLNVNSQALSWDPSLVQPKVVEVSSARYNFIPDPNKSQITNTSTQFANASGPSLFDEAPTNSENLFSTFGGAKPAGMRGAARVQAAPAPSTLVYPDQPHLQESQMYPDQPLYQDHHTETATNFGLPSSFNRKAFGERVTGADSAQTNQQAAQAPAQPQAQAQTQVSTFQSQAPAQNQGTAFQAQAQTQAPAQTQVTNYQYQGAAQNANQSFPSQASNLNQSYSQSGDIIPQQMRKSVSSQSSSGLNHEFRLYDRTITNPEIIQGQRISTPLSISTASYSSNISSTPLTQSYYASQPATYTNVIQEAPVTTVYQAAPATTYTTYQTAPTTTVYQQAAPTSYTTYSQSNIPATQTYTVTESHSRPSQVIYSQPTVIEAPIQSYTVVGGESLAPRLSQSQIVTTTHTNLASNPELQGLKLIGTYTDDKYATIRNI